MVSPFSLQPSSDDVLSEESMRLSLF